MGFAPKPPGKIRVILTKPDGTEFLVSGTRADAINGAIEVEVDIGVTVVYPMATFIKAEIDRT